MTLDELNQFRTLRTLIEHEREKLAELRASTLPHSPRLDGMPHVPGVHDPIGDTVPKIVDLEAEIMEHLEQYQQEWVRVHQWINSIPDLRILLICKLRFEDGLPWEEVADYLDNGSGEVTSDACRGCIRNFLKKK